MQESRKARPPTALILPPDSSIKSLVLLREAGPLTPQDTAVESPAQPPAPVTTHCYTIGPFITAAEAQRASVMLETEGLTAHPRTGGTLDNPEHWLDIGNNTAAPAPVSETLWQTLISLFTDIQQQPHACQ